jgi:hypothetical protein
MLVFTRFWRTELMTFFVMDHLTTLVKVAAAFNPITSAIVTGISEYVPSAHDRAVKKAAEALRDRLDFLGDRLEQEYVKADQFADLFKNWYFVCLRTQHEDKLRGAANILANALLREGDGEKRPYEELDHFTRCIESLSVGALRVLGYAICYAGETDSGRKPPRVARENVRVDFGILRSKLPAMDDNLLMGLIGELTSLHLLHSLGDPMVHDSDDRYRNYPIETTPLGYRFVTCILDPAGTRASHPA